MSRGSYLRAQNRKQSVGLWPVPEAEWPPICRTMQTRPVEVWRSQAYLVMVYQDAGHERLSVIRTEQDIMGRWKEDIPWDDLQRLKAECGRGERWAVEVFPPDEDVVNVQNMRHLFVLHEAPAYGWRREERSHGD